MHVCVCVCACTAWVHVWLSEVVAVPAFTDMPMPMHALCMLFLRVPVHRRAAQVGGMTLLI